MMMTTLMHEKRLSIEFYCNCRAVMSGRDRDFKLISHSKSFRWKWIWTGNGSSERLSLLLVLPQSGFNNKELFSIENYLRTWALLLWNGLQVCVNYSADFRETNSRKLFPTSPADSSRNCKNFPNNLMNEKAYPRPWLDLCVVIVGFLKIS